jgi:hypothetical protein
LTYRRRRGSFAGGKGGDNKEEPTMADGMEWLEVANFITLPA